MRAVIDTNIFISGIFFGGQPRIILDMISDKIVTPCFNVKTITELEQLLYHRKFAMQRDLLPFTVNDFLIQLKNYSLLFEDSPKTLHIIKEDPADNYFLACAISAQANFIISGDNHLLKLKSFRKIPIATPRQFLTRLKICK